MTSCQISLVTMHVVPFFRTVFLLFSYNKKSKVNGGTIKKVQMRSSIGGIFFESWNDACRVS